MRARGAQLSSVSVGHTDWLLRCSARPSGVCDGHECQGLSLRWTEGSILVTVSDLHFILLTLSCIFHVEKKTWSATRGEG